MFRKLLPTFVVATLPLAAIDAAGPTREQQVRADQPFVQEAGGWIYNDLNQGLAEARRTGKPLLVTLRCVT